MLNHITKVTLTDFSNVSLNQSGQHVPIQFSFLSENNVQCHPLVLCKDYLHDVLYSTFSKRHITIYGFTYGPEYIRIDKKQIKLLIVFPNKYKKEDIENHSLAALNLLHHYENLGEFIGRTTITTADIYNSKDEKSDLNGVVFKGPAEWLTVPALISLYTMLIRLGAKNFKFSTSKELQKTISTFIKRKEPDNDRGYLEKVFPYLSTVIKHRKRLFQLNEEGFFKEYETTELNINHIHNYRGILSLCCNGYDIETTNTLSRLHNKEIKC